MATERGKIGRLPAEARARINAMIRDNRTAEEIAAECEKLGAPGVTPQNISTWKQFGYAKWLTRQDRLEEMAGRLEFARSIRDRMAESGDAASDAASTMAVDLIADALENFTPALLQGRIAERPELVVDLVNALSKIRARDQAAVLLKQKVEDYQRRVRQLAAIVDERGSATREDVAKLFQEAYGVSA